MKNRQIFHRHPVSTTLLLFYLFTSFIQGNIELFFAGLLVAMGAFGLEFMFYVTGTIGMRRSRAGMSAGRDMYNGGNKASEADELHIEAGKNVAVCRTIKCTLAKMCLASYTKYWAFFALF